jgi:hypothetical protein
MGIVKVNDGTKAIIGLLAAQPLFRCLHHPKAKGLFVFRNLPGKAENGTLRNRVHFTSRQQKRAYKKDPNQSSFHILSSCFF